MKIIKFKKDKNNIYKIYFDDDVVISLYDDVIVKYNLLVNKEMDINKFNEIVQYNSFLDGYYKSIKYINKKMRTELEIRKYLIKLDIKEKDINDIIKLLYKDGYLNKEIYYKAFINDRYNLSSDGPLKVSKELVKLGYNENDFKEYLYSFNWDEKINKLLDKKIKLNHKLSNNMFKIKLLNDLVKLGYQKSSVMMVLDNIVFSDDYKILEYELNKIKNKYSVKYSGNELEYKVINYLFKKGFNLSDIKRCYYEN